MDGTDYNAMGLAVGALIYGLWQSIRSQGKRKAEDEAKDLQRALAGKEELVAITRQQADAWRVRYESEHEEYTHYRKERHDKDGEIQALLIRFTAENAELRAKTDLTPILRHQEQSAQLNLKMLESLAKISKVLDVLMRHAGIGENEENEN